MPVPQLASVARALSQLQKIFFCCLLLGFAVFACALDSSRPPEMLLVAFGFVALVGSLWMLVCVYKCASGSGRSGLLWLLIVFLFKLFGLIALCWTTRRWLTRHGVKVSNFGMSFELPPEEVFDDSTGFSRF